MRRFFGRTINLSGQSFLSKIHLQKSQNIYEETKLKETHNFKYIEVMAHTISGNPGSKKKRKRVGRGPGSNLGKTCGKGHKGQG